MSTSVNLTGTKLINDKPRWIFEKHYLRLASFSAPFAHYDIYYCSECGHEHHTAPNVKPIMPFCWKCGAKMNVD